MLKPLFTFIILLLLFSACTSTEEKVQGPLFQLVEDSGIDFVNALEPSIEFSAFDYVYYQNGGGVAIADLDLDGLEDVILTANMGQDRIYHNQGDLKFLDITSSSGLEGFDQSPSPTWSTGVSITDVNSDGYPDIYISKSGKQKRGKATENLLYVNQGDLTFKESAAAYGLNDPNSSTHASFFDYDRDGDLDAFILNHSTQFGNPAAAYTLDKFEQAVRPHSCSFYINDQGRFREASAEVGLSGFSFGLGVVTTDIDGDGWTDIYVAQDFSIPDKLYFNTGNGSFAERLKESVGHISQFSMGCDVADVDNDGLLDISVVDMAPATNYRSKTMMPSMSIEDFKTYVNEYGYTPQYMYNTLQLNRGNRQFSEIGKLLETHKTDWSWSTLLADFDNDGLKDQVVTNGYKFNRMENDFALSFDSMMRSHDRNPPPDIRAEWIKEPPSYKLQNKLFKNKGGLAFDDVSSDWGFIQESFSNGAAYSDLDNDGDLDLVINNIDDKAFVFQNTSQMHFLQLEIRNDGRPDLTKSLNTRAEVYSNGTSQLSESTLSRGFQSSSTSIVHFGLGELVKIDSLVVTVPNFGRAVWYDIPTNQRMIIDLAKTNFLPPSGTNALKTSPLFTRATTLDSIFIHRENAYDDFENELLLPHQNSRYGPFISKGDVNNDGLTDIYIGGAAEQSAQLFIQSDEKGFYLASAETWEADKGYEDMQSSFVDIDQDGDLDLYVVSGGNEWPVGDEQYQDRLYINEGGGNFSRSLSTIPDIRSSGSSVCVLDFNGDGQDDLFVGGRMSPQRYPYASPSYLLMNKGGQFSIADPSGSSPLDSLGIVTDASAADLDGDGYEELIIVGEWMYPTIFEFANGKISVNTPDDLRSNKGWWNCVEISDLDNDGDLDIVAGNLGLNYKYKASIDEPFMIYGNDFDHSGDLDIVLAYHSEGDQYPLRGRECSSEQMPVLLEEFPSYHDFASASLIDVYGEGLESAIQLRATEFASCIFFNEGTEGFRKAHLPIEAQFSSVNDIIIEDFDHNGTLDILLAGNLFSSEIETPRNDASLGCLLSGDGKGNFKHVPNVVSGLYERSDTKDLELIQLGDVKYLFFANNNNAMRVFRIRN